MFHIVIIQSTGESLMFLVFSGMADNAETEDAKQMSGSRIAERTDGKVRAGIGRKQKQDVGKWRISGKIEAETRRINKAGNIRFPGIYILLRTDKERNSLDDTENKQ